MRTLLALAAALLVPLTAAAQAPAAPATVSASAMPDGDAPKTETKAAPPSPHLAAAQRLYQKLDLDAALAELQLAEAARTSEDEIVQVLIYRGLIYSETGKAADAADQFKRALAVRPWAEVPPETSPRIAKTFSDARKSVWGMASVKPPRRRAAPAPATTQAPAPSLATVPAPIATPAPEQNAVPATATQPEQPKAEPALAK